MHRSVTIWILAAVGSAALLTVGCAAAEPWDESPGTDAGPLDDAAPGAATGVDDATTEATDAPEEVDDELDATADEQTDTLDESASDQGSPEPVELVVTAYVVGYHWGWAIFDEAGNELEILEVPVGATVELIAVNDHAGQAIAQLPEAVAGSIRAISWHDRMHHAVEQGRFPDLEEAEGVGLSEALAAAHNGHDHEGPTPDHALMVAGIGAKGFLDAHGEEPTRLTFTVDREGAFEFRCTEPCGSGHEYQRREKLIAVAA